MSKSVNNEIVFVIDYDPESEDFFLATKAYKELVDGEDFIFLSKPDFLLRKVGDSYKDKVLLYSKNPEELIHCL